MIQGSQEWLEWRLKGLGGSEVAPIMGIYKYSTPMRVWEEKVLNIQSFTGNQATQKGQELEARARARYELFYMEDMHPALVINPNNPIVRASLDGISDDGERILEIKCPGEEAHNIAMGGKVPDWYVPQVQWQLAASGAKENRYFSYRDDSHAIVFVKPDLEYQARMIATATEWWEKHVVGRVPPPLTEYDDKRDESQEVSAIVSDLVLRKDTLSDSEAKAMKAEVIRLAGHTRVRCGRVLITRSHSASGKETYRMTVGKEA